MGKTAGKPAGTNAGKKTGKAKQPPERIVIKVGTSVLTQANHFLDYNVIHQIVEQIGALRAAGHQVVLVTSGAAGAAHGLAEFTREKKKLLKMQLMTSVGQPRLMQTYADFFREHDIHVAQALLTRADFGQRERYLSIRQVLEGLLALGVQPIVNENDVVAGEALTFGDNDYLSAAVAATIGADRLFLLTTVGGFFSGGDPRANGEATLVPEVREITKEMWASCQPSLSMGGRGGMYSKLKAAEMVSSFGIRAYIGPGKEPNLVPRVLAGETLGTYFHPSAKRMKSYRQWLRFGALTNGRIIVDEGAEKALRNNKSLLPAGITAAEGNFSQGEVVEIQNARREHLGVGVIELNSESLRAMVEGGTATPRSQEAIHKDRLLIAGL